MRLILGISGASGSVLAVRLLRALRQVQHARTHHIETHLVVTDGASRTLSLETTYTMDDLTALADAVYDVHDLSARIASGSFAADGMIVVPCSMKTLAGIASGYADNLLLRAADVTLKEGRRLVLVPRETPLSRIHLRNLKEVADCGAMIVPPMLTFYSGADTVEAQIDCTLGKVLRPFGIELPGYRVWGEAAP